MSTDDLVEISQLLARYAVTITRGDIEGLLAVFTPDGTYSAFGDTYPLPEFPALVAAAPKGLFLTGTPLIEVSGDTGTGTQPLMFVDHATHEMRIGYYNDTYARTAAGWPRVCSPTSSASLATRCRTSPSRRTCGSL